MEYKRLFYVWILIFSGNLSLAEEKPEMKFTEIALDTWMYTSHMDAPGYPNLPLNGVVAFSGDVAVIVDLPESLDETRVLFDWIEKRGARVKYAIPQHWHVDSSGGLPVAFEKGVDIVMLDKTEELLSDETRVPANVTFSKKVTLFFGGRSVELTHFGGGHTVDSVVAWFGDEKVLVGGCLLKAKHSKSLGYIGDADMENYGSTLELLLKAYPDSRVVTPGHGKFGGLDVVERNIELLEIHLSN